MPGNIGLFILRMLQEFMQNSLRHAACNTITVPIEKDDNGLKPYAKDEGKAST